MIINIIIIIRERQDKIGWIGGREDLKEFKEEDEYDKTYCMKFSKKNENITHKIIVLMFWWTTKMGSTGFFLYSLLFLSEIHHIFNNEDIY